MGSSGWPENHPPDPNPPPARFSNGQSYRKIIAATISCENMPRNKDLSIGVRTFFKPYLVVLLRYEELSPGANARFCITHIHTVDLLIRAFRATTTKTIGRQLMRDCFSLCVCRFPSLEGSSCQPTTAVHCWSMQFARLDHVFSSRPVMEGKDIEGWPVRTSEAQWGCSDGKSCVYLPGAI